MGKELGIQRIHAIPHHEAIPQTLTKQCVFKVITPIVFDHGLKLDRMTRYRYGSGDLILARRHTDEWVRWSSESEMLMLELPDEALRSLAEASGASAIEFEGTPYLDDRRIAALIESVEAEEASHSPAGRLFLDGVGMALAAALLGTRGVLRRSLRMYPGSLSPAQLRRVTDKIHADIEREMTVAELAETAGLSQAYFSEAFRRSTGYPPHQFVLRIRIDRAKQLLRTTDQRIIDVAVGCGFQSSQQLAKVFQRLLKTSPTVYRRQCAR
jgi:AraC family transcriptional regulator